MKIVAISVLLLLTYVNSYGMVILLTTEGIMALHTFENSECGIKANVCEYANGGFIVGLHDIDADQNVGSFKIFPNEAAAIEYAKKIIA